VTVGRVLPDGFGISKRKHNGRYSFCTVSDTPKMYRREEGVHMINKCTVSSKIAVMLENEKAKFESSVDPAAYLKHITSSEGLASYGYYFRVDKTLRCLFSEKNKHQNLKNIHVSSVLLRVRWKATKRMAQAREYMRTLSKILADNGYSVFFSTAISSTSRYAKYALQVAGNARSAIKRYLDNDRTNVASYTLRGTKHPNKVGCDLNGLRCGECGKYNKRNNN